MCKHVYINIDCFLQQDAPGWRLEVLKSTMWDQSNLPCPGPVRLFAINGRVWKHSSTGIGLCSDMLRHILLRKIGLSMSFLRFLAAVDLFPTGFHHSSLGPFDDVTMSRTNTNVTRRTSRNWSKHIKSTWASQLLPVHWKTMKNRRGPTLKQHNHRW